MFKNGILCWENCPSCDAALPTPVGIGDEWSCSECGEYGQRTEGPYDLSLQRYIERKMTLVDVDLDGELPPSPPDDGLPF